MKFALIFLAGLLVGLFASVPTTAFFVWAVEHPNSEAIVVNASGHVIAKLEVSAGGPALSARDFNNGASVGFRFRPYGAADYTVTVVFDDGSVMKDQVGYLDGMIAANDRIVVTSTEIRVEAR